MTVDKDLSAVQEALNVAGAEGMTAEVVWSAMRIYAKFHKSAPETYDMEWAFNCALNDWDI